MIAAAAGKRKSLQSLQVLRAIAASVVAFYHTHLILAQPEYGGRALFGPVATRGWLGVNLFFVLSGFIIVYAHSRDMDRPKEIRNYVMKRFIRLYPIYWIFLAAYMLAAVVGIGHPDFEWSTANLLSAFVLVKFAEPLTLPLRVVWTLFYELTFYVMFILFLIDRKIAIAVFAMWSVFILGSVFVFDNRAMGFLNVWNLYFPVGMLGYYAYRHLPPYMGPGILIAGLVLLLLCAASSLGERSSLSENDPIAFLAFTLPFCMIIVGATLMEGLYEWMPPRFLLLLGEASYSIYLVHSGIISILGILYGKLLLPFFAPWVYFFLTAAISIFCGVVAHKLIELPMLNALRRLLLKPTVQRRHVASLSAKPAWAEREKKKL